ncbi:MAG: hypothetical protein LLG04_15530 [Parachlamydia sp.]|nr:hypothetical protein [Parachlamydia sp.]
MRFIIGFIFFAILFYAIYVYFPDTFQTMVSWDKTIFDFLRELVNKLFHTVSAPPAAPPATAPKALLLLMQWF